MSHRDNQRASNIEVIISIKTVSDFSKSFWSTKMKWMQALLEAVEKEYMLEMRMEDNEEVVYDVERILEVEDNK